MHCKLIIHILLLLLIVCNFRWFGKGSVPCTLARFGVEVIISAGIVVALLYPAWGKLFCGCELHFHRKPFRQKCIKAKHHSPIFLEQLADLYDNLCGTHSTCFEVCHDREKLFVLLWKTFLCRPFSNLAEIFHCFILCRLLSFFGRLFVLNFNSIGCAELPLHSLSLCLGALINSTLAVKKTVTASKKIEICLPSSRYSTGLWLGTAAAGLAACLCRL